MKPLSEELSHRFRRTTCVLLVVEACVFVLLFFRMYSDGGFWSASLRSIGILACLAVVFQVLDRLFDRKYKCCRQATVLYVLLLSDLVALMLAVSLAFALYYVDDHFIVSRLPLFAIALEFFYRLWSKSCQNRAENVQLGPGIVPCLLRISHDSSRECADE